MFTLEDFKRIFGLRSTKGVYISSKRFNKPIFNKKSYLSDTLLIKHLKGILTLHLPPVKDGKCKWVCLDIDIENKGVKLSLSSLNRDYRQILHVINFCLDKAGLEKENYLITLEGRGLHCFIFFEEFIQAYMAFDFVNSIKQFIEKELTEIMGKLPLDGFETRPSSSSDESKCIMLPGWNFHANRESLPLSITHAGNARRSEIGEIKCIEMSQVLNVIINFKEEK